MWLSIPLNKVVWYSLLVTTTKAHPNGALATNAHPKKQVNTVGSHVDFVNFSMVSFLLPDRLGFYTYRDEILCRG